MRENRHLESIEVIRYGFWGVITVIFNYGSYLIFKLLMPFKWANLLSIISTKLLAYYTNKKFVFKTETNKGQQVGEFLRFILTRGIVGVVDFLGLILWVDFLRMNDLFGKAVMLVFTTCLNYIMGKFIVFKK